MVVKVVDGVDITGAVIHMTFQLSSHQARSLSLKYTYQPGQRRNPIAFGKMPEKDILVHVSSLSHRQNALKRVQNAAHLSKGPSYLKQTGTQ